MSKHICAAGCILILALLAGCQTGETTIATEAEGWELIFEEQFSDHSYKDNWLLEGFADLSIVKDDEGSYLRVATVPSKDKPANRQSNLWYKKKFDGDLRFVWRAKGESGNRSIFYFNAGVTEDSKHKTIFDSPRPDAQMSRYFADENLAVYTVSFFADVPPGPNRPATEEVRYLGGPTAAVGKAILAGKMKHRKLNDETVLLTYPSPFKGKADTWFVCEVTIVGNKITHKIDGKLIFELEDTGNAGAPEYGWAPLTKGGYIAFRNFKPTAVTLDYIKVYGRRP